MNRLEVETWTFPGADLGPENPLPPLACPGDVHRVAGGPGVPRSMLRRMRYGRVPGPLPYTLQDGYRRDLTPREFRVAVLENEFLRAAFLLDYGGRLWSLLHKPTGRELLERNPVFQPANLAIRNAWFSGGVEWNIGTTGHCPFTCSPLFAAALERRDGTKVLRLWEWERIRGIPFQIDALLPDGSPVLYVYVRLRNPHERTVPMYWWSNIAVPETDDTRVLVPAESAFRFKYAAGPRLDLVPLPTVAGTDVTYPVHSPRSMDYFFFLPNGARPWITALDGTGRGLVQTSTARLRGRKLFVWGRGAGGRRWQQFLSRPDRAYIEIQAGLARTQAEHVPMPARAQWSWIEAYGLLEAPAEVVHDADWSAARQAAASALEQLVPRETLLKQAARCRRFADRTPRSLLHLGSGWGALEAMRRRYRGEPPIRAPGVCFPENSLGAAQASWEMLLRTGIYPAGPPEHAPVSFQIEPEWRALLEASVHTPHGRNWAAWYQLGIMRWAAGEYDAAREAWENSLQGANTPWSSRNLAILDRRDGNLEGAARRMLEAVRKAPSCLPLALECGRMAVDAGLYDAWLDLLETLPETVRENGRVRILEGQAALELGDLERVRRILHRGFVLVDLREGERTLSELWFAYHERRLSAEENVPVDNALRDRVRREFPVPPELDFRMS
ncbi:MAG: DUF5107 domain-containing protein [Kiritimatiellaeota bacterium]|nr:DUF5107 domain-containing protein [Kiritimatiellota bacterium]